MATMISTSLSSPAAGRAGQSGLSGFKAFWRHFFAKAFDPYRPELHYMRGPGRPGAPSMATGRLPPEVRDLSGDPSRFDSDFEPASTRL